MPRFQQRHLSALGAIDGAYSNVTQREAGGDKSVTVDRHEKAVLFDVYGDDFARTSADRSPPTRPFNVIDLSLGSFAAKELAIKYPKESGAELRLYFRRDSGFYPESGQVWFMFRRENEPLPFIGSCSSALFDSITSDDDVVKAVQRDFALDVDDDVYQKLVAAPEDAVVPKEYRAMRYERSAAVGREALESAGYACEFDNTHETPLSAVTGQPIMEVHHLVPISKSAEFRCSLDVLANVVSLCPNCHSAIHRSTKTVQVAMLQKLFGDRRAAMAAQGIDLTEEGLLGFY
ncbi:HNH endonuclease domain protein [Luminiphilus syltensis NOR5-1B]|uniref:HNH endonuclease domain protein n=1 Tax=Luminiphilus syltensis NOR5-1B TaxID=565045 RepID=B8KVR3_9GAMM|nr:HNH endonuclease [Luminiphilus syltensis]EED35249.1 HNH endonuclease domain protein [Luminiphilus syltensis NOR5-1B]